MSLLIAPIRGIIISDELNPLLCSIDLLLDGKIKEPLRELGSLILIFVLLIKDSCDDRYLKLCFSNKSYLTNFFLFSKMT